jgi:hypothetical protein
MEERNLSWLFLNLLSKACPYASAQFDSLEQLPSFVGGSCRKCVPGCVGDVTNDFSTIKAGGVAAEAPPEKQEEKPSGWLGGWW